MLTKENYWQDCLMIILRQMKLNKKKTRKQVSHQVGSWCQLIGRDPPTPVHCFWKRLSLSKRSIWLSTLIMHQQLSKCPTSLPFVSSLSFSETKQLFFTFYFSNFRIFFGFFFIVLFFLCSIMRDEGQKVQGP